jgi:cobalt transporter subunit CbtA
MIFRRLVWLALVAAGIVGTAHWALIQWHAVPIIAAAEAFEHRKAATVNEISSGRTKSDTRELHTDHLQAHGDADDRKQTVWEPQDGFERSAFTLLASVLLQLSFALALLSAITFISGRHTLVSEPLGASMLLAVAGFFCFFAWPAMGLPPEIPGLDAARLGSRQGWWALAAGCAVLAVAVAGIGRGRSRWLIAAICLAIPFIVGAPQISTNVFAGFDSESARQLRDLEARFLWTTIGISIAQWLLLGVTCGLLARRWLTPAFKGESPREAIV